ncbi:FAD:protein FMN transferase [Cellulomonas triticagri]|uniref:FAD:protein FMN transferase n=1 Tax=Cellulomonas triticagri TaxID=2483352 RepID=A0A3M2JFF4_9CELL|nr:FAD:protein FMN transferase [Cellulomonas triticagri]RMI12502.1 FAD:protein FMN transferase [Cellulomonas triticagri]
MPPREARARTAFEAIGTRWEIDTPEPLTPAVLAAVHERIGRFDQDWSRFRADSWVSEVARSGAGTYALPADAGPLLDVYDVAARCTDGAVSPLVGHALEDLGYDATYSLRPRRDAAGALLTRPAPDWGSVVRAPGQVTLGGPALLDVGAAGKGYLVDLVAEVLTAHGVREHVVDAGGDLRASVPEPLVVALEDPRDTGRALGTVRVATGAVCGSATNRRAWAPDAHHVVDARTGLPTRDVLAAWAFAPTALVADMAATALFFAEPDLVASRFGVRYVVLRADGSARWSLDLDGEVLAR